MKNNLKAFIKISKCDWSKVSSRNFTLFRNISKSLYNQKNLAVFTNKIYSIYYVNKEHLKFKTKLNNFELKIKSITEVTDETSIFVFESKKYLNFSEVEKIYSGENIKLTFSYINTADNEDDVTLTVMDRYYSLINSPLIPGYQQSKLINGKSKRITIKMLIKENLSLANHNLSLPYKLKESYLTKNTTNSLFASYPFGSLAYLGENYFRIKNKVNQIERLILICCGTGIAPNKQLIDSFLKNRKSTQYMEINLINISQSEENVYFNKDFIQEFKNSFNFNNNNPDDTTTKVKTINSKSNIKGLNNYLSIVDDYNDNLNYSKQIIELYIKANVELDPLYLKDNTYFMICGGENLIRISKEMIRSKFQVENNKFAFFY